MFEMSLLLVKLNPNNTLAKDTLEYIYNLWLYRAPVGSRNDGTWFAGNGYFNVSERALFTVPYLMGQLHDFDYFDIPWFNNLEKHLSYITPQGFPRGGYGDNAERSGYLYYRYSLLRALMRNSVPETNQSNKNYWSYLRLSQFEERYQPEKLRDSTIGTVLTREPDWYVLPILAQYNSNLDPIDYSQLSAPKQSSIVFYDSGLAVANTEVLNPTKNVQVNMRSNPYGLYGHGHAKQNGFHLIAGQEKLFFSSGYYSSSSDWFSLQNYKHTRAGNTILVNGHGSSFSDEGYGWIARHAETPELSYFLGDASNAYKGQHKTSFANTINGTTTPETPPSSKGSIEDQTKGIRGSVDAQGNPLLGFDATPLTKFRRHLLFLKPHHVVIYDELEASEKAEFTLRLNAPNEIEYQSTLPHVVSTKGKHTDPKIDRSEYSATATLYASTRPQVEVSNQWYGGTLEEYFARFPVFFNKFRRDKISEKHWHLSSKVSGKKVRMLTVIDISGNGQIPSHNRVQLAGGQTQITFKNSDAEAFTLIANLEVSEPALLEVNKGGNRYFTTGPGVRARDGFYPAGATVIEPDTASPTVVLDKHPDAANFSNVF